MRWAVILVVASGCSPSVEMVGAGTTSTTSTDTTGTNGVSVSSTTVASTSTVTTGPETSTTLDDDSSSTEAPMPFIIRPDGVGMAHECDIWNDECPRGEKCMPWANDGGGGWNATRCFPLDPNHVDVGDDCTVVGNENSGIDDCPAHAMCWNVDDASNMGECVEFCTGSEADAMCPEGFGCYINSQGTLALCIDVCNPLLQDCDEGEGCYPVSIGQFECLNDGSGNAGMPGDPCMLSTDCEPGHLCAYVPACADAACCTSFCDTSNVDANADCDAALPGTECVPWYERGQAPPGYENVGFCAAP